MANTPADTIYSKQNKSLHRAFTACGMPYNANKDVWQPVLAEVTGRKVEGISAMSLGERYRLIQYFQKKGHSLHNPRIYKGMWHWKKGETVDVAAYERPLEVPSEKRAMVSKIGAILAEHKLPWSYADAIAKKRFNVQVVEWLKTEDLKKVMQMLITYDRRHGGSKG